MSGRGRCSSRKHPPIIDGDMPKRRRPVRPVRRPNFQPAPDAPSTDSDVEENEEDEEAPPTFADEPVAPDAAALCGATGPVETRPHWISRDQRAQGRRMAQLRRSSGEERGSRRGSGASQLPTFAVGYISHEIRQIVITTFGMIALIVFLALVLR